MVFFCEVDYLGDFLPSLINQGGPGGASYLCFFSFFPSSVFLRTGHVGLSSARVCQPRLWLRLCIGTTTCQSASLHFGSRGIETQRLWSALETKSFNLHLGSSWPLPPGGTPPRFGEGINGICNGSSTRAASRCVGHPACVVYSYGHGY